ncbi:MAG: hypothetical protein M3065_17380, partial [Actinomycetota bacterium]|nr:hypothetical protein [Actinomycetota bacterium]
AELRTVLAGPLERLGGVRLLCAELYSDCVIVRWHRLLTPEEAAARDDHDPFLDYPEGILEEGRRWGAVFDLSFTP